MAVKKIFIAKPTKDSPEVRLSEFNDFLKDNSDYKSSNIRTYLRGDDVCIDVDEASISDIFFKIVKGSHKGTSFDIKFGCKQDTEEFATRLHNLLKGNKDYVSSNICLNYDDYVVRVCIAPESNTDIAFCFVE